MSTFCKGYPTVNSIYPRPRTRSSFFLFSELARTLPKITSLGHRQPRDRVRIVRVAADIVAPPAQRRARVAQRKKDEHRRNRRARVHGRLQQVIVPLPPLERALADQVVEHEAKDEPQRVLRRVGRRNVARRVEEDGHVDVAHPAVGVPPIYNVHEHRHHRPDEEEVHERAVHLARLEHALRANRAPDQGRVVCCFGALARESLGIVRVAEVLDVDHHPAENCAASNVSALRMSKDVREHAGRRGAGLRTCGLGRRGENRSIDLAKEQNARGHLHVLAHLQILRKVHAVLDRVVTVALDHHVRNRLARPCVPGNQLCDDVEEAVASPSAYNQTRLAQTATQTGRGGKGLTFAGWSCPPESPPARSGAHPFQSTPQ